MNLRKIQDKKSGRKNMCRRKENKEYEYVRYDKVE
jgi:hypothetical protein